MPFLNELLKYTVSICGWNIIIYTMAIGYYNLFGNTSQ